MKVGIDTFGCGQGRSGLGSYLLSLVPNLNDSEEISFELFGKEVDRYTYVKKDNHFFRSVNVPDSLISERFWHKWSANKFARKQNYDVVLYTSATSMLPSKFKVPGVALVNDIVSARINKNDKWLMSQIRKGFSRVDCIICSSQFIKDDLISLGVKCDDIRVIYRGVDHSLFYPREASFTEQSDVLEIKPFAIKRPYIIYAGKLQDEDKKHIELIKAFNMFKERTGLPHRLVIAGNEGDYSTCISKEAFNSPFASDIFLTGFFPHESFAQLYRNADGVIFPSVDDGSGLAVLEALASGVPVACSQSGALPEIAKDNAIYFDSNNIAEMSVCIERIVTDTDLRINNVPRSLEYIKDFSCEKAARETMEVLRSVALRKK